MVIGGIEKWLSAPNLVAKLQTNAVMPQKKSNYTVNCLQNGVKFTPCTNVF